MLRLARTSSLVLGLTFSHAPFQCAHSARSELAREESPGDALWKLSEKFKAEGNERAARETLRFLVEHYPSSRHAPAAHDELIAHGDSPPASSAPGR